MTGIRTAALALYQPPFKFTAGYIFDAGGKMVADDGKDDDAQQPLITARIRGWGRIQYLDNPKWRAAALQDEFGAIVCEALNAYWASVCATCNGIGMVGGPSYYQPDEGGMPCPDCGGGNYPPLPEPAMPASAGVCCGQPDDAYPAHYSAEQMRDYADDARAMLQPTVSPVPNAGGRLTAMVDAAMVAMADIVPPLRRSECERLILAAFGAAPVVCDSVQTEASSKPASTASEIAAAICQRVAELDDRNSPEGQPNMMLVTRGELHGFICEALATTPDADQADCLKNFRAILNAEINRAIDPSGDIARQEAAIDTTDHLLAEFSKLFPEA